MTSYCTSIRIFFFALLWLASSITFAHPGKVSLQLGVFTASQGKSQNIGIQGLIGDHYSVRDKDKQNGLLGLGYFLDGKDYPQFALRYGINAFYFFKTSVRGRITQEQLFTNLSYRYDINHLPIYATAKAIFNNKSERYNVTLDLGVGPNITRTSHYREASLDGGITIPNQAFSGQTSTNFSAMAGIGVRINNALGHRPIECGYRFFHLGDSELDKQNNQLLNTLKTGNIHAHALICGISV